MKFTIGFVDDNLDWIENSLKSRVGLLTICDKYEIKELYYLIGDETKFLHEYPDCEVYADNELTCKRISKKIEEYFLDNEIHFNKN